MTKHNFQATNILFFWENAQIYICPLGKQRHSMIPGKNCNIGNNLILFYVKMYITFRSLLLTESPLTWYSLDWARSLLCGTTLNWWFDRPPPMASSCIMGTRIILMVISWPYSSAKASSNSPLMRAMELPLSGTRTLEIKSDEKIRKVFGFGCKRHGPSRLKKAILILVCSLQLLSC